MTQPPDGPGLLAVTGASGQLGGLVARRLAAAGVPQRLLVRDLARAPQLPGAAAVRAPYGGPQALTLGEVAEQLTASTGRAVVHRPQTVQQARASRASCGAPQWQVEAWVSTNCAIAAGELAAVSTAVADVTGRAATSFAQVARRAR